MTSALIIWLPFAGLLAIVCRLFGFTRLQIVGLYFLAFLIIYFATEVP